MTPTKLILIKHSLPEMVPGLPANRWHLSEAGRLRCQALAEQIAPYCPDVIVASMEPKAAETAELVVGALKRIAYLPRSSHHVAADGLHNGQVGRLAGRAPGGERGYQS